MEAHRDTARGSGMDPGSALAQFMAFIGSHRLFAVFHLIAMHGLRRGEARGLKWEDLDLDEGLAYLSRQVQEGPDGRLRACPLKTESSCRAVAMGPWTVTVRRAPPQLAGQVAQRVGHRCARVGLHCPLFSSKSPSDLVRRALGTRR